MTRICAHPDCSNEVTNPKATFCSRKCQGSRTRYATTATAPVETSVELDRVHPADDNVRAELTDLDGLADSIREVGILQPLLLQPHPSIDGHYRIVAGHRRHAAARLAGLTHVPFVSYTVTVHEHAHDVVRVLAMAAENLQRVDLSPLEEARTFDRLRTAGLSQRKIAAAVGKTQAHVSRRLALLELPERAQTLVDTGRITLEEGVELGRLTVDELTELLDDPNVDWDVRWEVEEKIERAVERAAARRVIAGWKILARDAGIEILDTNPGWNHKGLDARSLSATLSDAGDVFLEYLNAERTPVCCAFTDTQVMLYLPRVTRQHPPTVSPPAGPTEAPRRRW
jgi:ParB/RepB/Spo0J family partition protein